MAMETDSIYENLCLKEDKRMKNSNTIIMSIEKLHG
jgi:hypothetical protein